MNCNAEKQVQKYGTCISTCTNWWTLQFNFLYLNLTCKTVFYRCNTCGIYIYKGKKFNSRKEDVEDETFLGLRIFRFYIKCPSCVSEIAFKVFSL